MVHKVTGLGFRGAHTIRASFGAASGTTDCIEVGHVAEFVWTSASLRQQWFCKGSIGRVHGFLQGFGTFRGVKWKEVSQGELSRDSVD